MPQAPLDARLRRPLPTDLEARMALGTSAEIVRTYGARAESAPSLSRVHVQRWWRAVPTPR